MFILLFYLCQGRETVYGFSPVDSTKTTFTEKGIVVFSGEKIFLRAFGVNLTSKRIWFTEYNRTVNTECKDFTIHTSQEPTWCVVKDECLSFSVDSFQPEKTYFACICDNSSHFCTHLGHSPVLQIIVKSKVAPLVSLWVKIVIVILGFFLTGLFSGLNLGLMSLGLTELQIIEDSGTPIERQYAKTIRPVRKRGNLLLCTILFGNVLVNTTITIILADIVGSGVIAVVTSTLGIVILGEIIPQAVCSRHSLKVGAKTIWITIFFIIVTFPLSFPISFILTKCLGEEIGQTFSREKLIALIRITVQKNDPKRSDAMNIIAGALEISKKTVKDVMTLIEDVYMISYDSILNFETMYNIMQKGYTRIPIFQNTKCNIVAILNVKDLTFVGPDDSIPLKTICNFYRRTIMCVLEQTSLEAMLKDFLTGRSHMAIVRKEVGNVNVGDIKHEVTGLITLEDIIEEILQAEIVDETDSITDNRHKRKRVLNRLDFTCFNTQSTAPQISPQMMLAAFQFLFTSVEIFSSQLISENVLRRLLKRSTVVNLNIISDPDNPNYSEKDSRFIYRFNQPADYFVLILQGRCEVCVGKEKLLFDATAFSYFGTKAIKSDKIMLSGGRRATVEMFPLPPRQSYICDFSLQAMTDVQYIRISASDYTNACRATALEMQNPFDKPLVNVDFIDEIL